MFKHVKVGTGGGVKFFHATQSHDPSHERTGEGCGRDTNSCLLALLGAAGITAYGEEPVGIVSQYTDQMQAIG
jgi:hypothetical protein